MNVFLCATALTVACVSPVAFGFDVVTGVGVNYKNIDMSFERESRVRPVSGNNPLLDGRISQDMSFQSWQPFLQANIAGISGNYYFAVNGETDLRDEGSDVDVSPQRSPGLAYNLADSYTDKNVDVNRDDLGVTVGWRGIERVALFVGFRYDKTNFDGTSARQFISSGPLVGASYSISTDRGLLTFGGAFARLSGTYDEDSPNDRLMAQKIDGDANGFSAFINWSAPLTDRLRYLVELRWQRYDFDGSDSWICGSCTNGLVESEPMFVDQDFSVRETLYGAGVNIVYAL
jgi:hypothetical protein